ncbi:hypothetical protein NKI54_05945 [Mesorhizobium sp. M0663]|uniref:hypothetical protein n=1 Tax=Mesorhizobium sp. M0663 TaxID=2956981 RepID=UPI00333B90DF
MAEKHSTLVVEMARVVLSEIPQNIDADMGRMSAVARLLTERFRGATKPDFDAAIELIELHRQSMILDALADAGFFDPRVA